MTITPKQLEEKLVRLGELMRQAIRLHYQILKEWSAWLQMMQKVKEVNGYVKGNTVSNPHSRDAGGDGSRERSQGNKSQP